MTSLFSEINQPSASCNLYIAWRACSINRAPSFYAPCLLFIQPAIGYALQPYPCFVARLSCNRWMLFLLFCSIDSRISRVKPDFTHLTRKCRTRIIVNHLPQVGQANDSAPRSSETETGWYPSSPNSVCDFEPQSLPWIAPDKRHQRAVEISLGHRFRQFWMPFFVVSAPRASIVQLPIPVPGGRSVNP